MYYILTIFVAFISLASAIKPTDPLENGQGTNGLTHPLKPSYDLKWEDNHNKDICIYLWEYNQSCMAGALLTTGVDGAQQHWTLTADKIKNTQMECVDSDRNQCQNSGCLKYYNGSTPVRKDIQYKFRYYYNCGSGHPNHSDVSNMAETVYFFLDW